MSAVSSSAGGQSSSNQACTTKGGQRNANSLPSHLPSATVNTTTRQPCVVRILQVVDLHLLDLEKVYHMRPAVARLWERHMGNSRRRTLDLLEELAESQQIDLIVLCGNILDGRGRHGLEDFQDDLEALCETLDRIGLPWVYLPGASEAAASGVSRADLLGAVRHRRGCVIPAETVGFDYVIRVCMSGACTEFIEVLILDAPQRQPPYSLSRSAVEAVRAAAVKGSACGEVPLTRVVFVNRPLEVFDEASRVVGHEGPDHAIHHWGQPVAIGSREEASADAGLIKALYGQRGALRIDGIFCASRHTTDCVRDLRKDGGRPVLLVHGRIGSFFPTSEEEGDDQLPFQRGARVVEVAVQSQPEAEPEQGTGNSVLRTWVVHEAKSEPLDLVELDLTDLAAAESLRVVAQPC